jgi:hypothetical protein
MLSIPDIGGDTTADTTYVWDEKAQGWSTWSMTFSGAVRYSVDNGVTIIPPDTMYFTKQGQRKLFRYKASDRDNGTDILSEWRSPVLLLDNQDKAISAIGVWSKGLETSGNDTLVMRINNEFLVQQSSITSVYDGSDYTPRYRRLSVGTQLLRGVQIRFTTRSYTSFGGSTPIFDGIDIYYHRQGGIGE